MDTSAIMSVVVQNSDSTGRTDFDVDEEQMTAQGLRFAAPDSDLFQTARHNAETGKLLPKIFMTCGADDFIRAFAHASRDLLSEYGYEVYYEEVPGYAHEWDFWDLSLRKALTDWLPIRHDVIPSES